MLKSIIAAGAFVSAALFPASLAAQTSPLPTNQSFHLVQLSVNAADIATEDFRVRTEAIRNCNEAVALGNSLGADIARYRTVRARRLPEELRSIIKDLKVGHATPVFVTDGSVLRVLVLCNRV